MTLIRLFAALSILVFFSLFVSSNLLQTNQNSGTFGLTYLIAAFCAFVLALTLSGDIARLHKLKRPTIFLAMFLAYTIAKYYLEAEAEQIQQVVYGSTQGLLFSLTVGLVVSYALFTIYNVYDVRPLPLITSVLIIGYLIFVALSIYSHIQEGSAYTNTETFRVVDDISYQRPGDLLILQLLVTASVAQILLIKARQFKFTLFAVLLALVVSVCALTSILSQLFWSNKGLLAGSGIAFAYLICSFITLFGRPDQSIKISNILFGRLSLYLLAGAILGGTIIAVSAISTLSYFDIDYTQLRAFEGDEIRSVTSRQEIFKENFPKHFGHSPVFGNTQVEKIFGDDGYYVHSTLSILTHLGVVGFIIFLFLIIGIYLEMTRGNSTQREDVLTNNSLYGLLRLSLFSFILAMGLYSAFFTWMPLWFSIGFFGTWFSFKPKRKVRPMKNRKKRRKQHTNPSNQNYATDSTQH